MLKALRPAAVAVLMAGGPFELANYAPTYTGYQLLKNALS
jgi:hypothetical protein